MNCKKLPSDFKEFKIRFLSWDISKLDIDQFIIAKQLLIEVRHSSQNKYIVDRLNDLSANDYKWVIDEYNKRPLNENGKNNWRINE